MSVMGTLVNSSGYHVTGSLPPGLWSPKRTLAMASPPAWPGYPAHRMAPILGFDWANVTSTGPPVRSTRITGRFAAAATAVMRLCCFPGRRRLVLSSPSFSCS
uniref:Uncharacterized protein n=1 Tax=Arundo donax TaxID=35708 RepID=A0A0A9CWR2_ARUDO